MLIGSCMALLPLQCYKQLQFPCRRPMWLPSQPARCAGLLLFLRLCLKVMWALSSLQAAVSAEVLL